MAKDAAAPRDNLEGVLVAERLAVCDFDGSRIPSALGEMRRTLIV